jgi:hypothetical protein
VHLRDLPPFTTLLVWTLNSLYRVVITQWPEVYIQGGAFFPDPAPAYVDGASSGGSCLRVGWIGVGLLMEIHSGGRHIMTSPVLAVATEQPSGPCHSATATARFIEWSGERSTRSKIA